MPNLNGKLTEILKWETVIEMNKLVIIYWDDWSSMFLIRLHCTHTFLLHYPHRSYSDRFLHTWVSGGYLLSFPSFRLGHLVFFSRSKVRECKIIENYWRESKRLWQFPYVHPPIYQFYLLLDLLISKYINPFRWKSDIELTYRKVVVWKGFPYFFPCIGWLYSKDWVDKGTTSSFGHTIETVRRPPASFVP